MCCCTKSHVYYLCSGVQEASRRTGPWAKPATTKTAALGLPPTSGSLVFTSQDNSEEEEENVGKNETPSLINDTNKKRKESWMPRGRREMKRYESDGSRWVKDTLRGHLGVYPPTSVMWVSVSFSQGSWCCFRMFQWWQVPPGKHSYFLILGSFSYITKTIFLAWKMAVLYAAYVHSAKY